MNRRDVLKGISLSVAYAVSAPGIMSVLQSCTDNRTVWKPVFFSEGEKVMVTHLVDIILPASDLPGGLDVNLPQFIDVMIKGTMDKNSQELFQRGGEVFALKFKEKFGMELSLDELDRTRELFREYFDVSKDQTNEILANQSKPESDILGAERDKYVMYKFLFTVRNLALKGYYTSEKISKEVLNFDPIPGSWKPCVPLEEIGNAWAI